MQIKPELINFVAHISCTRTTFENIQLLTCNTRETYIS